MMLQSIRQLVGHFRLIDAIGNLVVQV